MDGAGGGHLKLGAGDGRRLRLGALIIRAQPVFEAIKWAGVAYLAFLGAQAIRSAIRGRYGNPDVGGPGAGGPVFAGWRQGFLSNITNPKVLVFYLAVLPQFLTATAGPGWLLAFAWSHAVLSVAYLLALSAGLHSARRLLLHRKARRSLEMPPLAQCSWASAPDSPPNTSDCTRHKSASLRRHHPFRDAVWIYLKAVPGGALPPGLAGQAARQPGAR